MKRILRVALLAPLVLVSLLSQPALAAPGFHAAWVDQSPWPVLRPGAAVSYTIHFRNTGTEAWQRGIAGRQVNLGVSGDSTAAADEGVFVLVVSDPGLHSAWVGQSPYPTLQAGQVSAPLSVVFRNTGTQTWTK